MLSHVSDLENPQFYTISRQQVHPIMHTPNSIWLLIPQESIMGPVDFLTLSLPTAQLSGSASGFVGGKERQTSEFRGGGKKDAIS